MALAECLYLCPVAIVNRLANANVPSDPTITDVTITKACVDGEAEPTVLHDPEKVAQRAKFKTGTADKPAAPAS